MEGARLADELADFEHEAHVRTISKLVAQLGHDFLHNYVNCLCICLANFPD